MKTKYFSPHLGESYFTCPHCEVMCSQDWKFTIAASLVYAPQVVNDGDLTLSLLPDHRNALYANQAIQNLWISICQACKCLCLWLGENIVYPDHVHVAPSDDLPKDVREDFTEAARILNYSPRGAAAILRLGLQKFMISLGEGGKNLNEDIGSLVRKGLNPTIQKALDLVRVIGNNAVHPGQIDMKDNRETAEIMFSLINMIAEDLISRHKRINEMYENLPHDSLSAIQKRDEDLS